MLLMRLSEMIDVLDVTIRDLDRLGVEPIAGAGGEDPPQRLVGILAAKESLLNVAKLPLAASLEPSLSQLRANALLQRGDNSAVFAASQIQKLSAPRASLLAVLRPLRVGLASVAPPVGNERILLKLPVLSDLAETAKLLTQLSRAFDTPLGHINEHPLHIEGVESGSAYLLLAAGSAAALKFIANLVDALSKALDALSKYRAIETLSDAHKLDAGLRKEQEQLNQKAQGALIDRLASELAVNPTGDQPREHNPEFVQVLVQSIKDLQEISNKGAEIRLLAAAAGAKSETKAVGGPQPPAAQLGPGTPASGGSQT